ncbi:MAG: T9SS type A sorting domain-containing protein [Bacteroidetes bacterium]|nr:T9SS type A sorting domain-containing protein [Bacteroidota bacterium]
MNLRHLAVAAVAAATATAAQQPFKLNTGFRTQFQQIAIGDVLERPDGKIIVSGRFVPPGADPTSPWGGGLLATNGNWIPKPIDRPIVDWYFYMGNKIVPWGDEMFYVGVGQGQARYWQDGTWDSLYPVQDPKMAGGQGGDFHVYPDGRLLLAGNFMLHDPARGHVGMYGLVWLNTDGSLDTTMVPRSIGGPIGAFEHIQQQPDGKFLCSGGSGWFEGVPVEGMFRVNSDGSLDTTFQVPHIDGWTESYGFLPQSDGKTIAYGRWHFAGSADTVCLVRFLPNGHLDPSFNNSLHFEANFPGTWSTSPIVMHVEPIGDGMLAVTGKFERINGDVHGSIAMIDTAGNLLPGYFQGTGCSGFFGDPLNTWHQTIIGIKPSHDGGYFIYGAYHGYDDGTTNDPSQALMSKLYGLNVGISEHTASPIQPLEIAPNPGNGGAVQLTVGTAPKHATLTIHDASGRVVWQEVWPAGAYTHTLRAGLLAPGTYVVRVQEEEQRTRYSGKLIVLP